MPTPHSARVRQLQQLSPEAIAHVLDTIRRSETIPSLEYHFRQHGRELGVTTPDEYLRAFQRHLERDDPRVFTYVRERRQRQEVLWELVAPDTGATVMYNESRGGVHSFFRPSDPARRAAAFQRSWVEVSRIPLGWRFEEQWQW